MSMKQCLNCGKPSEGDFCCDSCEEEYFEGDPDEDTEEDEE